MPVVGQQWEKIPDRKNVLNICLNNSNNFKPSHPLTRTVAPQMQFGPSTEKVDTTSSPCILCENQMAHIYSTHDVHTCTVPWTQSQIGDRSLTAAGPWLWNSLPIEIRRKDITFEHYRRLFKANLFVQAAAHCDFLLKCAGYKYAYSLTHSHAEGCQRTNS